jgi:hypothetical protein
MRKALYIVIVCLFVHSAYSQHREESGVNLPKFYKNKVHFGFSLAYNKTDFRINTVKNSAFPDTLIDGVRYGMKSIYTKSDPGFALGIISDFRLHDYLRIRFTPNISFASRNLDYTLQNDKRDSTKLFTKTVESTFLLFPIELKLQSKRLDNFGAYVIGGGGFAFDLVSKKKGAKVGGTNQLNEAVQLQRNDYFYSAGAGVDFYLMYFKLGLELKVLKGTQNLINPLNNIFSKSVQKVNSQMLIFSITFEG